MKKIIYITLFTVIMALGTSCKKQLVEENHSKLTEGYFATSQGIDNGLNAVYGGLRTIYGPEEGIEVFTNVGADEMRIANGNRTTDVANYSSAYNSSNEFSANIWNNSYKFINTCNGLVDFGANITGVTDAVKNEKIAEAKFLRAFYYFNLVQLFGGVTLNKSFSTTPTTSASRVSLADCYAFIVEDLKAAIKDLTPSPKQNAVQPGRASAAAAKHLLAKVYLTRAYSAAKQATDFQDALATAKDLIGGAAGYGLALLTDYADVFKPLNETNQEVLFSVQYSRDLTYGGSHTWNHLYVTSYNAILGERNLNDGRSYAWYRGTNWLYNTAFADKVNDSRYYKTFQSVWIATLPLSGTYTITVGGASYTLPYSFAKGDTAMVYPGYNMPIDAIKKKKYVIYTPENYTDNRIYPTMTKYLDPNRLTVNENSHRPIIVMRLAETYLVAAEAAFQLGQPDVAAGYINTIRARAASPGKQTQMQISTSDINIDFILDERTRELCSEQVRWFDLVRTGKLIERVRKYDDFEARKNIKDFDILRPIPLTQINAVITGTPYPQNPGW